MALFPPEFLAGLLLAFLQIRLRSHLSIAARLVNGLSFFLPPDDELLAALNGKPPGAKGAGGSPLPAADKLAAFYVRSAQTEPGVFAQTLFYELYEMLVVVVTSALGGCAVGDLFALLAPLFSEAQASPASNMAVYGLFSALLVSLWFPLQLQRAQGLLVSYESRLALSVAFVAFVVAAFAIAAPKNLFDFDVEAAADLAGQRLALALRAFGFVDEDFVNIAPATEAARWGFFALTALAAAGFASTLFLPSFRFARMYMAMTRRSAASSAGPGVKPLVLLLLHLNMWSPMLLAALWVPALVQKPLVDSLALLSVDQFRALRLYLVLLAAALRLLSFRRHLQFFLLEPRDTMAAALVESGNGPVDGAALQRAARVQFNYAPVVAIQYLAPVGALVASAALLARQGGTSLGVQRAVEWAISSVSVVSFPNATAELVDLTAMPDLGGFRLGDELTRESAAKLLKGMAAFPVLLPAFYTSVLGFLVWFLSFSTLVATVCGILYWKNVSPVQSFTVSSASAGKARGKASKKSLKLKKH